MACPKDMLAKEERLDALCRMLALKELCIDDLIKIFKISETSVKDMCNHLTEAGYIKFELKIAPHISTRPRRFYKATELQYVPKTLAELKESLKKPKPSRLDGYLKFGIGEFFNPWVKKPEIKGKATNYSPLDYLDYSYQRIDIEPNRGVGCSFNII